MADAGQGQLPAGECDEGTGEDQRSGQDFLANVDACRRRRRGDSARHTYKYS